MSETKILFARQPIYNCELGVEGYELLYRPMTQEDVFDDDKATSQVVMNTFMEVGLTKATESSQAFINFPESWLLSPPPFEPHAVVIEVLESVPVNANVISAVKALKDSGYRIALDDFEYDDSKSPLIELADIIKLDVLVHRGEALDKLVHQLKPFNKVLLAEKVEDYQLFSRCQELGFTLFQGYFLCRPQIVQGQVLPANKLVVMRLLADLQNPDISIKDLENSIANDPTLGVKLLKVINSAQYAIAQKVESLQKAIVLLGLQKLKAWASMIALFKLSDKPSELLTLTLTRAKMLELMAQETRKANPDKFFTVGLFSSVDAFFDQEKSTILESLPLEKDIGDALLEYKGEAGILLKACIHHEQGEWNQIPWSDLNAMGIDEETLEKAYFDGLRWALDVMSSLLK